MANLPFPSGANLFVFPDVEMVDIPVILTALYLMPKNGKEQFLELLSETFSCQDYFDLARSLFLPVRTAEGYIARFCENGLVFRDQKNSYIKRTISNP